MSCNVLVYYYECILCSAGREHRFVFLCYVVCYPISRQNVLHAIANMAQRKDTVHFDALSNKLAFAPASALSQHTVSLTLRLLQV